MAGSVAARLIDAVVFSSVLAIVYLVAGLGVVFWVAVGLVLLLLLADLFDVGSRHPCAECSGFKPFVPAVRGWPIWGVCSACGCLWTRRTESDWTPVETWAARRAMHGLMSRFWPQRKVSLPR